MKYKKTITAIITILITVIILFISTLRIIPVEVYSAGFITGYIIGGIFVFLFMILIGAV